MNGIIKFGRNLGGLKSIINSAKHARNNTYMQNYHFTRCLSHLSKLPEKNQLKPHFAIQAAQAHSKGERELVEFLTEEILAERKAQKAKTIPTEIDGFQVKLNAAEVTLTKKSDNEMITIRFNVNHTVDSEHEAEINPNMQKEDIGELKSKPAFKIDLLKENTTITLLCSFNSSTDENYSDNDIFGIDEISIYDGDWHENVYAVSGEIVDSYLYDLLLNYLEEKGITNEFAEKVSDYATAYEHSAYISLLEGLSKFVSGK